MKYVALAMFVVGLGLMTGCSCMTCPMCKKGQANGNVGQYQIISVATDLYKFDTQTGQLSKFKWQYPDGGVWEEIRIGVANIPYKPK